MFRVRINNTAPVNKTPSFNKFKSLVSTDNDASQYEPSEFCTRLNELLSGYYKNADVSLVVAIAEYAIRTNNYLAFSCVLVNFYKQVEGRKRNIITLAILYPNIQIINDIFNNYGTGFINSYVLNNYLYDCAYYGRLEIMKTLINRKFDIEYDFKKIMELAQLTDRKEMIVYLNTIIKKEQLKE